MALGWLASSVPSRAWIVTVPVATRSSTRCPARILRAGSEYSDASKETYLYFEARQDGSYYIAHRAGTEVHKLVEWTPNAAVKKIDDAPNASNELAIKVAADSVRFIANGTQVHALPRGAMLGDMSGQVGVRVNHNLDVHVGSFTVKAGGK